MASFKENFTLASAVLASRPQQVVYIEGAPGNGKTSLALAVFDELGIQPEKQVIFRPSLRDPVDLMGVPHTSDRGRDITTKWATPEWLKLMSTGRWGLCIDELPQGVPMMQNALAGLILDRQIGDARLSDEVFIIATGNRAQDRAGASRVLSHLSNRMLTLQQETDPEGWSEWAVKAGMPAWLRAFIKYRPALLNTFDPAKSINATERTWEMVGRLPELGGDLMYRAMSGLVDEGAATEALAFRGIMKGLTPYAEVVKAPKSVPVPIEPAQLFAMASMMAETVTKKDFDACMDFVVRMPPEFQVLFIKDAVQRDPSLSGTARFVAWGVANHDVVL